MTNITTGVVAPIAGLIIGFLVAFFIANRMAKSRINESELRATTIIHDAEKTANNIKKEKLLEVKEEWAKKKLEFDSEVQTKTNQLRGAEKQVKQKEKLLDDRFIELAKKEKLLIDKNEEISKIMKGQTARLEKIAGLSRDEAKNQLMESLKNEVKAESIKYLNGVREETKLKANQEASNIILTAIQRSAADYCVETTVSVVNIENDEIKGRIIGREGRNIRTFEAATGVDLIIDDTPESIVISGFDPFRREVARKALLKLMQDGRIHPARIEELVNKTKKELEEEMLKEGESVILELGLHNMHNELIRAIGRMRYRTSYGQNLLNHSLEVAYLAGIIAVELGLDQKIAKRAAILHDIGKCVDKDTEGPHAKLGADLAKKFKENATICNAIAAHHEDIDAETPYSVIVQAADSISGARPGARRESVENYVKRLEKLEEIGDSFEGVGRTFAIQAGREIRVIVEPEKLDDVQSDILASDIAKRIETEMEYPGQIKVTVIRERRSSALAK